MTPKTLSLLLGAALLLPHPASAFNYALTDEDFEGGLSLTDTETSITDIKTIFTDEATAVSVVGLVWVPNESNNTGGKVLLCETFVGGEKVAEGEFNLTSLGERELPGEVDCGSIVIKDNGRHEVTAKLSVDGSELDVGQEFEAFAPGVAIIPLLVVLVLAMTTQMVEFSLFFAIFVGACMVSGNIKDGFKTLLDDYILNALASVDHAYVYLFTLFLSGMVGMMERSGGMIGFTRAVAQYAKTPRAGQFSVFLVGCMIFFDDYANTLLAGETMRPLTDMLFISREKLAFVVDATAAPIASLVPISSWVGFEVGLIEAEIERIQKIFGDDITIETSGLAVFLESIKYRYYPIFMMLLIPVLILSQRDFGPMLIAERKTQVYQRTDGGDGSGKGVTASSEEGGEEVEENKPKPDTPCKPWNMLIPIVLLVFFIFYLLVKTGDDGSGDQSFMDKIEGSDSYSALLWGTMATANITTLMYMFQIVQDSKILPPWMIFSWPVIKGLFGCNPTEDEDLQPLVEETGEAVQGEKITKIVDVDDVDSSPSGPRSLMSLYECSEAFLYGLSRIFPALVVLTLAWASGSIMIAVGADRLFSRWIVGGVSAEMLPTLSFLISGFMALATGTSWGTMTILFPLICLPTYTVSNGDPVIFYATVAGILSGSVAGDHVSPISDTTVLSSLASDCDLLAHVVTQAPYSITMSILAILFGTLPIGKDAWPNIVGILLGAVVIGLFVYGICVPVLCPTGRVDIFTWLSMKSKGEGSPLHILQTDTIRVCGNDEEPLVAPEGTQGLNPSEHNSDDAKIPPEQDEPDEDAKPLVPDTATPIELSDEAVA